MGNEETRRYYANLIRNIVQLIERVCIHKAPELEPPFPDISMARKVSVSSNSAFDIQTKTLILKHLTSEKENYGILLLLH